MITGTIYTGTMYALITETIYTMITGTIYTMITGTIQYTRQTLVGYS